MDTKAALGAAAGLTLTMAGGVSALFLTTGLLEPASPTPEPPAVVVEYVDPEGNPVEAPTTSTAPDPEVVFVYPDQAQANAEGQVEAAAAVVAVEEPAEPPYEEAEEEYPEEEYPEEEYPEEEYAEAEHEEDHDEEGEEYDDD